MRPLPLDGFFCCELEDAALYFQVPQPAVCRDAASSAPACLFPLPPFVLIKRTSKNRYTFTVCKSGRADVFRATSLSAAATRIALFFHDENSCHHP